MVADDVYVLCVSVSGYVCEVKSGPGGLHTMLGGRAPPSACRRPQRRRCDLAVPPAQPNSECLAAHSIV